MIAHVSGLYGPNFLSFAPRSVILIRESKCVHCGNCMAFTEKGCMIAKSLSVTKGGTGMDLKGMNCYQNFGFQQNFLEHFMEYGTACFSRLELGNQQYASLKKWLEHSGMIAISAKDRSVILSIYFFLSFSGFARATYLSTLSRKLRTSFG